MPELPEVDLNRREKLEFAWETFADLILPGINYREELARLRYGEKDETLYETEQRLKRLARRESGLRQQFLSFVRDGYFNPFGIELDRGANTHEVHPIHHSIFDAALPGFKIYWDENRIEVLGKTFVGIEFQPDPETMRRVWKLDKHATENLPATALPISCTGEAQSHADSDGGQAAQLVSKRRTEKPRPGPKSVADIRRAAILNCLKTDPDLARNSPEIRLARYKRQVMTESPAADLRRGFSLSAFQDDEKHLRNAGLI